MRGEKVEDAPWLDVVCKEGVLRQLLRQRAAEVGGTVLTHERCEGQLSPKEGGSIRCRADVVAAPQADAGLLNQSEFAPRPLIPDGVLATRVHVSPAPGGPARRGVDARLVREKPLPPLDHLKIAGVATRCERCGREDVETALRAVVASLGGVAVSEVSCRELLDGWQCFGDAMAAERERAPLQVW